MWWMCCWTTCLPTPSPASASRSRVRRTPGHVELVVEDDGPGLPAPDQLGRGRSSAGSTGLGLDIVSRMAGPPGGELRPGTATAEVRGSACAGRPDTLAPPPVVSSAVAAVVARATVAAVVAAVLAVVLPARCCRRRARCCRCHWWSRCRRDPGCCCRRPARRGSRCHRPAPRAGPCRRPARRGSRCHRPAPLAGPCRHQARRAGPCRHQARRAGPCRRGALPSRWRSSLPPSRWPRCRWPRRTPRTRRTRRSGRAASPLPAPTANCLVRAFICTTPAGRPGPVARVLDSACGGAH